MKYTSFFLTFISFFCFSLNFQLWAQDIVLTRSGGQVVLTKSVIGLSNVDNTSDANKPISTATQVALDLKENSSNKSSDIFIDATSDTKYPTAKAVKDYLTQGKWSITGNAGTNPNTHFIGTTNASYLTINSTNTERIRITADGNVGIGTATPTAKLTVLGGMLINNGSQVNNRVFVSDANGLGSWANIPTPTEIFELTPLPVAPATTAFTTTPSTLVVPVISSVTGRIWMDRNLGASRRAQSFDDYQAYGQMYQWGRGNDGHADVKWTATTGTSIRSPTSVLSLSDYPENNSFIIGGGGIYDWRSTPNSDLWKGVNGVNNPCPAGYRIPTQVEFQAEVAAYGIKNGQDAFNSPLRLTLPGKRHYNYTNYFTNMGTIGTYWTARDSNNGPNCRIFYKNYTAGQIETYNNGPNWGFPVRCIKD